jgi:U4/U6 small nuclear ribonucleoprotein PRP31
VKRDSSQESCAAAFSSKTTDIDNGTESKTTTAKDQNSSYGLLQYITRTNKMEGGSTLADSLLDDLDDLSDEQQEEEEEEEEQPPEETPGAGVAVKTEDNGQDGDDPMQDASSASKPSVKKEGLAIKRRYLDNSSLQQHLQAIRKSHVLTAGSSKEDREEEHHLIVQSNKMLANLSDELARAHGVLCTIYKPKFSELEELLPNPVTYKNAVQTIGNEMDIANVSDALHGILNPNQVITISVAGSTTNGRPLTDSELEQLKEAIQYVEDILKTQLELTEFVEGRMESLAPSVCALVGPSTAAKLVGLAGGLAELSKIPSCNLQVLGQVKHNAASRAGMSSISTRPHQGLLAECDLVTRTPKSLQRKSLKTVAAKLALAARCDFVNVDAGRTRSAATGRKFRQEIESKIQTWMEPEKAQTLKALPK